MAFSINSKQLAFVASKLSADEWAAMQRAFLAMGADDAGDPDVPPPTGVDPGSYGGENFAGSMYRDATVGSGMAAYDRVIAALDRTKSRRRK